MNLRWEIDEKTPATVNRIEILGNDYTNEACIREQLVILPGDVFNQDRLIRSYQNIQNLNFFESPLPPPDTKPANDQGDVDIIFRMKEKRTGQHQLRRVGGPGHRRRADSSGSTQPNLFGACKSASLQWQFGQFINDFQLSYTDPSVKQSRISATVTAYHTQSRYTIADLGQSTSSGGVAAVRISGARLAVHPVLRVLRRRSREIQRRSGRRATPRSISSITFGRRSASR